MKSKKLLIAFAVIVVSLSAAAAVNEINLKVNAHVKNPATAPDLSFLRTHRQGKGAEIIWGVTSTDGVAGFVVQRTYEDPNDIYASWENISSMSCNPSKSFKCSDDAVYPGFISYRVLIVQTNGARIASPVSTVHIMARH
jgi:hypothetical protein